MFPLSVFPSVPLKWVNPRVTDERGFVGREGTGPAASRKEEQSEKHYQCYRIQAKFAHLGEASKRLGNFKCPMN